MTKPNKEKWEEEFEKFFRKEAPEAVLLCEKFKSFICENFINRKRVETLIKKGNIRARLIENELWLNQNDLHRELLDKKEK